MSEFMKRGPTSSVDVGYVRASVPEPQRRERTPEEKAADAETIAGNFDNQAKVVREYVTAMETSAAERDLAGWISANSSAAKALVELERWTSAVRAAASDATDAQVHARMAGAEQVLKDVIRLVAEAPTAPEKRAPVLSCTDALLAVLPPADPAVYWPKAAWDSAAHAVENIFRNVMTYADITAFQEILAEHNDHEIARQFGRFDQTRRNALVEIFNDGKVRARARTRAESKPQVRRAAVPQASLRPVAPEVAQNPVSGGSARHSEDTEPALAAPAQAAPPPSHGPIAQRMSLDALERELGPGAPIDGAVAARMSRIVGADVSGVRIHTGPVAAMKAAEHDAAAFTVGQNVVMGGDAPATGAAYDALLAHELTHTAQQKHAATDPVARQRLIGDEDEAAERNAGPAGLAPTAASRRGVMQTGLQLQRWPRHAAQQPVAGYDYYHRHAHDIGWSASNVVEQAPFSTYHAQVRWTAGGAERFAHVMAGLVGRAHLSYDDLESLVRPELVTSLVDIARVLDKDPHTGGTGTRGPNEYFAAAGIEVGNAIVRRTAESLQRMIPRFAYARLSGLVPTPDDVALSHPIDRLVVTALATGNNVTIDPSFKPGTLTLPRARRDLTLAQVGVSGMWWHLESPVDATVEEIALQLLGDTTEAFRIENAHPLYGIKPDTRKADQDLDPAAVLIGNGGAVVDEAALYEAGPVAPKAGRSREEILEQMRRNARLLRTSIREAAQRFGLGDRLEPAAKRIDDRLARLAKADAKQVARWDHQVAAQANVLKRASEGLALDGARLAAYAPQFSVDLSADPSAFQLPGDHRAVLRADAELWTDALAVSDLAAGAEAHLHAAAQHSLALDLEILERGLGATRDADLAVTGAKQIGTDMSAGTLVAREQDSRMKLARLRGQLLADPSQLDAKATKQTTDDVRDLIFESQIIANAAALEEAWAALDDADGWMATVARDDGLLRYLESQGKRYGLAWRNIYALHAQGKRTEARTRFEALCIDPEFQGYLVQVQRLLEKVHKRHKVVRLVTTVILMAASMGVGMVLSGVVGGALGVGGEVAAASAGAARTTAAVAGFASFAAAYTLLDNRAFSKDHHARAVLGELGKNLVLFGALETIMLGVRAAGVARLFEAGAKTDAPALTLSRSGANAVAEMVLTGGVGMAFAIVEAKVAAAMDGKQLTGEQVTELVESTVAQTIIFTITGRLLASPLKKLNLQASYRGAKWKAALDGWVAERDALARLAAQAKPVLDEIAAAAGRDRAQAQQEIEALEELKHTATTDPDALEDTGLANAAAVDAQLATVRTQQQRAYALEMGLSFQEIAANTFLVPRGKVPVVLKALATREPKLEATDPDSGAKTWRIPGASPGDPAIRIVEDIPAWARTPSGKQVLEVAHRLGIGDAVADVPASRGDHLVRANDARARGELDVARGELETAELAPAARATLQRAWQIQHAREAAGQDATNVEGLARLDAAFSRQADEILARVAPDQVENFLHLIADPRIEPAKMKNAGGEFFVNLAGNARAIRFARRYGLKLVVVLSKDLSWSPALEQAFDAIDTRSQADPEGTKSWRDELENARNRTAVEKLLGKEKAKPPRKPPVRATKESLPIERGDEWETRRLEVERDAQAHHQTLAPEELDLRTDCEVFFEDAKALKYRQEERTKKLEFLDAFDHVAKASRMPQSWINAHRGPLSEALFNPEFGMRKARFLGKQSVVGPTPKGATIPDYKIEHGDFIEYVNQKSDLIDRGAKDDKKDVFISGKNAATQYLRIAQEKEAKNLPDGDRYSLDFVRDPGEKTQTAMLDILFSDGTIFRVKIGDSIWFDNPKFKVAATP